jgi:hypothetical protein
MGRARTTHRPVRVLALHGMIEHNQGFSEKWQEPIGQRLGLVRRASSDDIELVRGYDVTIFAGPQPYGGIVLQPSRLRITRWMDPADSVRDRIVYYEVLWAPSRDDVKNRFLACFEIYPPPPGVDCKPFTAARPNDDRRFAINASIKNGLLVGGFADAAIVLSPMGDVLRDDVALAMCTLAADVISYETIAAKSARDRRCDLVPSLSSPDQQQRAGLALRETEFFAITHSLGSFLLLDGQYQAAMARATKEADKVRETLAFSLLDDATVFMFANQVALLELGRLRAVCELRERDSKCPNRSLLSVSDVFKADMPLMQMTTYVAFNDANDLLGFELPPYLPDAGLSGTLVNVTVRNPGRRFLHLFKDPSGAHTRQGENPAIIEAVVEGLDLSPTKR